MGYFIMRKSERTKNYWGELVADVLKLDFLPKFDNYTQHTICYHVRNLSEAEAHVILNYYGLDRNRCDDFQIYATRHARNVEDCIRDFWSGMYKLDTPAFRETVSKGGNQHLRSCLLLAKSAERDMTLDPLCYYMDEWMCKILDKHGKCKTMLDLFIMERKGFSKTVREHENLYNACYKALGEFFGPHWFPKGIEIFKEKGNVEYFEPTSEAYAELIERLFAPEHVIHFPPAMRYVVDEIVNELPEEMRAIATDYYGLMGQAPLSYDEILAKYDMTMASIRVRIDKIRNDQTFQDQFKRLELFSLSHDELLERALAQRQAHFDMIRRHLALVAGDEAKQIAIASEVPIEDLSVSPATYRALQASHDTNTLADFIGKADGYLLSIKGIGQRNLAEIKRVMVDFGLTVKE